MSNRRWYDQEPACSRLLRQLQIMPHPEAREFCARVCINMAEKLRKDLRRKGKHSLLVSSIGLPAISSLYRFGTHKRRWYDHDPTLYKAVSLFYTLPMAGLTVIGFKLGDSFGLIHVYATVCQQLNQPPDPKAMARICTTAMEAGQTEAKNLLIDLVGKDAPSLGNADFNPDLGQV